MPIYVYKNLTTGETFEIEQRITEDALTEHPETGDPVKRLIQPVGIAFKGSGFYVTDSRSASNAASKPASSDTATAAGSSDASGGSSDAKSTAKSDGKSDAKSTSGASSSAAS